MLIPMELLLLIKTVLLLLFFFVISEEFKNSFTNIIKNLDEILIGIALNL